MSESAYSRIENVEGKEFFEFFSRLLSNHWTLNDHGEISYIPLGEQDYEWIRKPLMHQNDVIEELVRKNLVGEDLGIVITYENTRAGGSLLYSQSNKTITFSWNSNRQEISSGKLNFDWYIEKIKKALDDVIDRKIKSAETDSGGQSIGFRED